MSGLISVWLVLVFVIFLGPLLSHSPTLGNDLIRYTIRLALVYYAVALTLLLRANRIDLQKSSSIIRLARTCWTLAWLTYLVHLAMAFHYAHGWSHADAIRHTEEVSGFGPGIFVSHFFTLVWTADVAARWLAPQRYAGRPAWMDWTLHIFMLFVVFNGTVVFETGLIRWAGVAMFAWLAGWMIIGRGLKQAGPV